VLLSPLSNPLAASVPRRRSARDCWLTLSPPASPACPPPADPLPRMPKHNALHTCSGEVCCAGARREQEPGAFTTRCAKTKTKPIGSLRRRRMPPRPHPVPCRARLHFLHQPPLPPRECAADGEARAAGSRAARSPDRLAAPVCA
jgi:hypothetical protein